jgi:hypothetical protein
LITWYVCAGLAGFAVEAGLGNAFPQAGGSAITACMMLVFAFPGFTLAIPRQTSRGLRPGR